MYFCDNGVWTAPSGACTKLKGCTRQPAFLVPNSKGWCALGWGRHGLPLNSAPGRLVVP
jgi:hypothetical protein